MTPRDEAIDAIRERLRRACAGTPPVKDLIHGNRLTSTLLIDFADVLVDAILEAGLEIVRPD